MATEWRQAEEYLERLWYMQEEAREEVSYLAELLGHDFDRHALRRLAAEDMVLLWEDGARVALSESGKPRARRVVRAHRLGERLIHDAFGGDFEPGACELEHTVTSEILDSICILLGHPRECPHGLPIPEGECCREVARVVESPAISLTELGVGQQGRIVYVRNQNDKLLHKLDGLQLRPGSVLKLHQRYPTFVVECEGVNIALSTEIAESVCVWASEPGDETPRKPAEDGKRRGGLFKRLGGK